METIKKLIIDLDSKPKIRLKYLIIISAVIMVWLAAKGDSMETMLLGDPYINLVKNSGPDAVPDITFDKAFSNYFKDCNWQYYKGQYEDKSKNKPRKGVTDTESYFQDNFDVVEFTGKCLYNNKEADVVVQFLVDEDINSFSIQAIKLNGIVQNEFIQIGMICEVFGDYMGISGEEMLKQVAEQSIDQYFDEWQDDLNESWDEVYGELRDSWDEAWDEAWRNAMYN